MRERVIEALIFVAFGLAAIGIVTTQLLREM